MRLGTCVPLIVRSTMSARANFSLLSASTCSGVLNEASGAICGGVCGVAWVWVSIRGGSVTGMPETTMMEPCCMSAGSASSPPFSTASLSGKSGDKAIDERLWLLGVLALPCPLCEGLVDFG